MDAQLHFNSYENQFYQDYKSDYQQYHNNNIHSYDNYFADDNNNNNNNNNNNEYTFLPENNLYENIVGTPSPMDATRQSTDVTDTSEMAPITMKTYQQPAQNYQTINYNPNMISYNKNMVFKNQPQSFPTAFLPQQQVIYPNFPQRQVSQMTMQGLSFPQYPAKVIAKEEEDSDSEDSTPDSAQLKSLVAVKVWCEDKDELLLQFAAQYKCDWKKIAKRFNNKKLTPHFLKLRYKELTCAPIQRRVKFNHKEDLMIAKYFEKYGSNWAQMAVHFENRTAIMLKNRYYSFIRKRDLLPFLVSEVRDIENDNHDVDTIGVQEAERYTTSIELKTAYEQTNATTIFSKIDEKRSEKHPIFGYESESSETANPGNADQQKEIERLKAKIKSLQTLYSRTKCQLNKLKSEMNH